jgi:hypothetical protein
MTRRMAEVVVEVVVDEEAAAAKLATEVAPRVARGGEQGRR